MVFFLCRAVLVVLCSVKGAGLVGQQAEGSSACCCLVGETASVAVLDERVCGVCRVHLSYHPIGRAPTRWIGTPARRYENAHDVAGRTQHSVWSPCFLAWFCLVAQARVAQVA